MKRGSVVTIAMAGGYGGKPRPAVIIQGDEFDVTASVTLCLLTTTDIGPAPFRVEVAPSAVNGLALRSFAMADKVTTSPLARVGREIGRLGRLELARLDRALIVFLGLGG